MAFFRGRTSRLLKGKIPRFGVVVFSISRKGTWLLLLKEQGLEIISILDDIPPVNFLCSELFFCLGLQLNGFQSLEHKW